MIIQTYKSRITGRLFEDFDEYRSHHRTALIHKKYEELISSRKKIFGDKILHLRETASKISDIEDWMIANSTFLAKYLDLEDIDVHGKVIHYQITEFNLNIRYNPNISNTHWAPLNGGITNRYHTLDKPTSYPGFQGRVKYKCIGGIGTFPSVILEKIGIFSRTGEGGGGTYSYDICLFDTDWPALNTYRTLTQ